VNAVANKTSKKSTKGAKLALLAGGNPQIAKADGDGPPVLRLPGSEEAHQRLAGNVPVDRLGEQKEVAKAVVSLVDNPFVTTQTLSVDDGMHPR
jgi:NAD(P)-dependent dehydrogenase (short-subunit alcohol dehydrogenase family)